MKTAREIAETLSRLNQPGHLLCDAITDALLAYGDQKLEEACAAIPIGIEWQESIRALRSDRMPGGQDG